jgi:DNA-binding protein H-NS
MKKDMNRKQAANLSDAQFQAAVNIRRLMMDLGISMPEVRSYYRLHAPPPKQARRVLTIAQRVALNQIKLLVRRHQVTEQELKRICDELGGSVEPADCIGGGVVQEVQAEPTSRPVEAELRQEHAAHVEAEGSADAASVTDIKEQEEVESGAVEEAGRISETLADDQTDDTTQQKALTGPDKSGTVGVLRLKAGDPGWVKYRHPETGDSWNGVGSKPGWLIKALLHDGMLLRDLLPIENFPLEEETAGLPAGVPFEELAVRYNLRQAASGRSVAAAA